MQELTDSKRRNDHFKTRARPLEKVEFAECVNSNALRVDRGIPRSHARRARHYVLRSTDARGLAKIPQATQNTSTRTVYGVYEGGRR